MSVTDPAERPYITCQELIEFLADYVAGELPGEQRVEFVRHLGVCPSCIAYLDTYKQSMHMSRAVLADPDAAATTEMSSDIPEELVLAVLNVLPRPQPERDGESK